VTKEEISKILMIAMAIDNRLNVSDKNLFIAKIEGWSMALSKSMTFEFAKEAVGRHYANSSNTLMPADLNALWRVQVDRIKSNEKMLEIGSEGPKTPMPDSLRVMIRSMGKFKP
jgi:hypothetical protein